MELVFPGEFNCEEMKLKWAEWIDHKKRIKNPYKSTVSQNLMLVRLLKEHGLAGTLDAIDHSIAQEYKGIYADNNSKQAKNQRPSKPFTEEI